jgi:hypothetical protein
MSERDYSETARRNLVAEVNFEPGSREDLEQKHGRVWDTSELQKDFQVHSFAAPYCVVVRKIDNERGTIMFQHDPRYYFSFSSK